MKLAQTIVFMFAFAIPVPYVGTALAASPLEICVSRLLGFAGMKKSKTIDTSPEMTTQDLTLPLSRTVLRFPGDPEPVFKTEHVPFGEGSLMMSELQIGAHIGTHIDAPAHFISGGKTVDQLAAALFLGEVVVVDLSEVVQVVTREDLEKKSIPIGAKVFIKTSNSRHLSSEEYKSDHVFLDKSAANYLIERRVKMLGFDYYNVDSSQGQSLESHILLAQADIPVIVAINLNEVQPDTYYFSALPLRLSGLEASPVRVVLWKN